jgi:hypothetical protein
MAGLTEAVVFLRRSSKGPGIHAASGHLSSPPAGVARE